MVGSNYICGIIFIILALLVIMILIRNDKKNKKIKVALSILIIIISLSSVIWFIYSIPKPDRSDNSDMGSYYLYGEIHCLNDTYYTIDFPVFKGYDEDQSPTHTSLVTSGNGTSMIKETSYGRIVEIHGRGNVIFFSGYYRNGTDHSFSTEKDGECRIYSNTSDVSIILESAENLNAFRGFDYSAVYNGILPNWTKDKSAFIGNKEFYQTTNDFNSIYNLKDFPRTENSTVSLKEDWNTYFVRASHWNEYS